MTQSSEDRLPDEAAPAAPKSAQILPFERPRSELQKAVQLRAQEALDLDRDRAREARKISPLRTLVIFALAAIPVYLLVSAVDGFVRVLHRVNTIIDEQPPPPVPPAPPVKEPVEPGVVILVNPGSSSGPAEQPPGRVAPSAADTRR
jgi:hypothetical protein